MASKQLPKLTTEPRQRLGTRYARRLRAAGRLPAIVYGHEIEPVSITLDSIVFTDLLHEHAHLVEVDLAGKAEPCLIKDVQWDHLGSSIVHVDLTRVDLSEEVEVDVELELFGESKAAGTPGAVLDHPLTSLTIRCRADSIPEKITVDISGLALGDSITVADLVLPAGVKAVNEPEQMVAQISFVAEQTEEAATAADGAEPEVIGKGGPAEGEEGEAADEA